MRIPVPPSSTDTTIAMARTGPMTPTPLRQRFHACCFACGDNTSAGLGLRCEAACGGVARARFIPQPWMRGYADRLHGGIVATVLDSAMTQCLFQHGVAAVTADLRVRFRRPALMTSRFEVIARIVEQRHGVWCAAAELLFQEVRIATATARFVNLQYPEGDIRAER